MGIEVEPTELLDFMEQALEERKGGRDRRAKAAKDEGAEDAGSERRSGKDRRKQASD